MISNVHHYPIRLFAAIMECGRAGALIIESRDRVQINHDGQIVMIASYTPEGWLVDMTGSPSDSQPHNTESENS